MEMELTIGVFGDKQKGPEITCLGIEIIPEGSKGKR